ncbi:5499_t:CDS:2 [Paraglomus brasilianum]|uniref:D-lactate dehydratase n=1 Tax=Paraglomus brasilianum TaxID=144538 RepID=A0A9N9BGY3_9GLOM|nr:5499_t:CDS:2 [Paraglomus brasilianum]
MAPKKVLVFLADGSEEIEATVSIDILRRARLDVTVAGVALKNPGAFAECSRGVNIVPDTAYENLGTPLEAFDAVIIPGGLIGAKTLAENAEVKKALVTAHNNGHFVAAICAGPIAIKSAGINKGGKLTSHPCVKEELEKEYEYQEERVVVDNKVISSRGPGTAFLFALTIIEQLLGEEVREEVSKPLMLAPTL